MKKAVKIVEAKSANGVKYSWNLNLLTGPKWFIVCGECEKEFIAQMPLEDNPVIKCKYCGTKNQVKVEYSR